MNKVFATIAAVWIVSSRLVARADELRPPRPLSTSIDILEPAVGGALSNLWGTFIEEQAGLSEHLSIVLEQGYLESGDYRPPGGSRSGLHTRMAIVSAGLVYWPRQAFSGPFLSIRPEGWLVAAEDKRHVVATGNQFDVNFQPGWQWRWQSYSITAGASLAYASGPARSADGSVAFPIHGFTGTPHLRVGWVW